MIEITCDHENAADLFWQNIRSTYPQIATNLEKGTTQITDEEWQAIQKLPGFSDGPRYARYALVQVDSR